MDDNLKSLELRKYEVRSLSRNKEVVVIRPLAPGQASNAEDTSLMFDDDYNLIFINARCTGSPRSKLLELISATSYNLRPGELVTIKEPVSIIQRKFLQSDHTLSCFVYPIVCYEDKTYAVIGDGLPKDTNYFDNRKVIQLNSPKPLSKRAKSCVPNLRRFTCRVEAIHAERLHDAATKYWETGFNLKAYNGVNTCMYGEPCPKEEWHAIQNIYKCESTVEKACAKMWDLSTRRNEWKWSNNPWVLEYRLKLQSDDAKYTEPTTEVE